VRRRYRRPFDPRTVATLIHPKKTSRDDHARPGKRPELHLVSASNYAIVPLIASEEVTLRETRRLEGKGGYAWARPELVPNTERPDAAAAAHGLSSSTRPA
jgi:hypothetical protein